MTRTVEAFLGRHLDADDWARRHAAGRVPDAHPYGLDRLARHGWAVAPYGGWPASTPRDVARGVTRRLGGGHDWALLGSSAPRADALLAWDERVGAPLALRHGGRVPVVTGVIWATDRTAPHARALVGASLRRAAAVVVLSSAQAPAVRQLFGVAEHRVHVLPFGVDTDFFSPERAAASGGAGGGAGEGADDEQQRDPDLVVTVGNDRDRDWATALAAHARLRRERPSARLVVVSATAPDAAATAPGVTLVRELEHAPLRDLLGRASAALVTTRPNLHVSGVTAALEALATGCPAVATRTPGMSDYAAGGTGLQLVPAGDADGAARALQDLLDDPAGARSRGADGREHVVRRFSTEAQAGHLAGILTTAAAS